MSDMAEGILGIIVGIALVIWMFWYDENKFIPRKRPDGTWAKAMHQRKWLWIVAIIFILGGIGGVLGIDDDDDDAPSPTTHEVAKSTSQNLPNQKNNKDKATKHEFYWTSKSDDHVRYFVDDDKKITAIKYVAGSDPVTAELAQSLSGDILHDDNLEWTNDRLAESAYLPKNNGKYNVYSPKHKKWYWVRMDANNNYSSSKQMVASFAIYPGKSSEAK